MRTLRQMQAGLLAMALLGGLGGAVLAQDDADIAEAVPREAAVFDGTMLYPVDYQGGTAGGSHAQGVLTLRGYGVQGRLADISDPRLSGRYRMVLNQDFPVAERGSGVWMASGRIDNADGSWLGHFTGYRKPNDLWYHQRVMTGTGAYEGLSALVLFEDTGFSYHVHGMVFPGDLPEAPAFPEPAE